jgi:NadR type nicotinamide-nucleotide adenylyltransferase
MAKAKDVIRIAVLGAESTGKTWLCEKLAAHYKTVWVPEYAREYFNNSDIYNYTLNDLETIARKQLEMEDAAGLEANTIVFCDTSLITLKIWAELEFVTCPPSISDKMYNDRYDLYLITENDVEWENDPLRQNKHSRELLKEMNVREVIKTGKPFCVISGKGNDRLGNAIEAVNLILH